jgi:hypothetical protein
MCCFDDGHRDFARAAALMVRHRDRGALGRIAGEVESEARRHDLDWLGEEFARAFRLRRFRACQVTLVELEVITSRLDLAQLQVDLDSMQLPPDYRLAAADVVPLF